MPHAAVTLPLGIGQKRRAIHHFESWLVLVFIPLHLGLFASGLFIARDILTLPFSFNVMF